MQIDRGTSGRPEVALTFDAGSDPLPTARILEALASARARCTFFLTGEWVERSPALTRRIAAEGHELANHSWDHPPFTRLPDDEIREQLLRTEAIVRETTGRSSRPYFRPPLGDRDRRVLQAVGDAGFYTVYWSLDSRDSVDRGITPEQIRDRVLGAGPGAIVLMHCGSEASARALPAILAGLAARGLAPVTLSRLLRR